jgi:hypothetical protein
MQGRGGALHHRPDKEQGATDLARGGGEEGAGGGKGHTGLAQGEAGGGGGTPSEMFDITLLAREVGEVRRRAHKAATGEGAGVSRRRAPKASAAAEL